MKHSHWYRAILGACTCLVGTITFYSFHSVHEKIVGGGGPSAFDDTKAEIMTPRRPSNNTTRIVQKKTSDNALSSKEIMEKRASSAHAEYGRNALDTIISNDTIIGDASWLLDFGIIGFGKCGTSTMMVWLKEHPEVQAFGMELRDLMIKRPHELVRRLYTELLPGPYQRGYKAPQGTRLCMHRYLQRCSNVIFRCCTESHFGLLSNVLAQNKAHCRSSASSSVDGIAL